MIAATRLLAFAVLGLLPGLLPVAGLAALRDEVLALEGLALAAVACAFVGLSLVFALAGRPERFDRADMLKSLALLWLVLPLFGALPMIAVAPSPFDAWVEAVSALTTTGSTVFATVYDLPVSILIWRGLLQWYGGLLSLAMLMLALSPLALGGIPHRPLPLADRAGVKVVDRFRAALSTALPTYGALTLVCFVALAITGVPAMEAFAIALSTLSTGGMMPVDGGMATFGAPLAAPVLALFLFIAATSLLWHRQILRLDRWPLTSHREAAYIAAAGLGVAAIAWAVSVRAGGLGLGDSILIGTSLVSGTGIGPTPGAFGPLPVSLVILMVVIGGGSFSPAGGFSFYRMGGMLVQAWRELLRLVHPHSMRPARIGSQIYDMQLMKAVWAVVFAGTASIAAIALAAAATGLPFEAAIPFATTQLANAGPFYDPAALGIADVPPFHALPDSSKVVAVVAMTLGRVETLALMAIVYLAYWRP